MITYYHKDAKQASKEYILNLLANPPSDITVDVETVSLVERMPLGFAIAFSPDEAIYFPTYPEFTPEISLLKPCMHNPEVRKAMHNIMFDLGILPMIPGLQGLDRSNLFDTNTSARLLGRLETKLETLASAEVGIEWVENAKSFMAKYHAKTMLDCPPEAVADKCQRDARATYALRQKYQPMIDSQYPEYFKVEMSVIPILIDVSMRGIAIDQNTRAEMEAKLENDIVIYRKIIQDAGIENPGSPQQVGYILVSDRTSYQ